MKDDTPSRPAVHALLTDGATVRIRPVEPGDHDQLERLYAEMSPDNRRLRFFSAGSRSAGLAVDTGPCSPNAPDRSSASSTTSPPPTRRTPPNSPSRSPTACTTGAWEPCSSSTSSRSSGPDGITAFTADALSDNHEVLRLFANLGLTATRRFGGPEAHCTIDLHVDETYLTASDARGRTADVASLEPLLKPRSIAVVGTCRRPTRLGGTRPAAPPSRRQTVHSVRE